VRGAALVGLVLVAAETPDREVDALRTVLEVRGGVSSPVDGLARVPVGFRQAVLALRTLGPFDTVACLDERLPEAMLLQSPELAEQLVRTWLGSLLDLPEPERGPLLATLHAWVETSGSAGRTAEHVHCHRNTVLNRLRRLTEATGHDLTSGTMPVELVLALRAHRLLGPSE
jgi:DNA-binding PucR family transcriptional regulator